MKYLFASFLSLAALAGSAHANDMTEITSVEVISDEAMVIDSFSSEMTLGDQSEVERAETNHKFGVASIATAGEVIQVARDLVALGEEVYTLVQKGKAVVNTTYAPVSVLPRVNGRAVDAMDLAGWRMPVSRTMNVNYKNIYGMTMASIEYKLVFSYGGSYNGKGAYITNAQIVPSSVYAFYGVNFDVTMRLAGLTNHGSVANPVAGAMLQLHYKAGTFMNVRERNDTYQITGRGQIQKL